MKLWFSGVVAVALMGVAMTASAHASFPGENGLIAYRQVEPATGLGAPLFVRRPGGSHPIAIDERPGFFTDWRADGRRIAMDIVQPTGDDQIATIKPDGRDFRFVTSGTGIHDSPSWSPDGRRIAFNFSPDTDVESPTFETRLWTIRADGSGARALPMRNPGFDVEPKYSPTGRWIAFARMRNEGSEEAVFVVRSDGGRAHRLTPWGQFVEHPTWSPDGRWIIFNLSPNGDIQVIRPNGRSYHTILPASAGHGYHKPSFSPDGTRIVSMCENQGTLLDPPPDYDEDICTMRADGTHVVNLTRSPGVLDNYPSWGPAPTRLSLLVR
jgi:Tol biopolymer transport system component